jgi:hypothetical protein
MKQAEIERKNGKLEDCIKLTTVASRISPLFSDARLLRAQCYIAEGSMEEAAGDLT